MRAMVLEKAKTPLRLADIPIPRPGLGQVQIKVQACGVCRTDLHIFDGELTEPKLPLVLGHQIVGTVSELGKDVIDVKIGDRIGVPWLGGSCGHCTYCKSGQENLCDNAIYTGYQIDGGFAEFCVANAKFTFPIPSSYPDLNAAPLLCGGLIGFRALRFTENAKRIGFYGFGSSAHMLIQAARYQGREVYAFTRSGDTRGQAFAKSLGAAWVGNSDELPPKKLDAAIIFAPDGKLVPQALKAIQKGGVVVCAGIHMSDIPSFPYEILWGERSIKSVTNLTRKDGEEMLALAPKVPIKTEVKLFPLEQANEALNELRNGKFVGSAVIEINVKGCIDGKR